MSLQREKLPEVRRSPPRAKGPRDTSGSRPLTLVDERQAHGNCGFR